MASDDPPPPYPGLSTDSTGAAPPPYPGTERPPPQQHGAQQPAYPAQPPYPAYPAACGGGAAAYPPPSRGAQPHCTDVVHVTHLERAAGGTLPDMCPRCGAGRMSSQPDMALIICLIVLAFLFTPLTLCCIPCAFRQQCTVCQYAL